MRLLIRARRRKISERPFADSGRFPDAVPKSSGRWPRKKVHRYPAAGAGAARSVLLSRSVEDQNPLRFFCEGLALINSEMGLGRTFRAKTLGSASCQLAPQPRWLCYFRFHCAPPKSGKTNRFARMSMIQPASTTRPNRCVGGKSDNTKMAKPAAKITSE